MKQTRTRIMHLISPSDFRYAARQYRDYAIAKEMQDDLKVMAYTALGNLKFDIKESKEKQILLLAVKRKNIIGFVM